MTQEMIKWLTQALGIDPAVFGAPVPAKGPGSPMTNPLGTVAPYNQQGRAIRDPATNARLSEAEHIQPRAIIADQMRNPSTGQSPYDRVAYRESPTDKISRAAALDKTRGDMDALRAQRADPTDPQAQADASLEAAIDRTLDAGQRTGDASITEEGVNLAAHGQMGVMHEVGKPDVRNIFKDLTEEEIDAAVAHLDEPVLAPEYAAPKGMGIPLRANGQGGAQPPAPPETPPPASEVPVSSEPPGGAAAAEGGLGATASAGLIGGAMGGAMAAYGDYQKVKAGQMSVGDAAVDVGEKTVETGGLTVAGSAIARAVGAGGAEAVAGAAGAEGGAASGALSGAASAGGIIGGVVGGGLALIDDVGKVKRGEMTGGHATVDVGVKAGVGIAAGIAGAEAGAAIGAAVGSIIPGAGTAVGFVAGAVVGAGVGYVASALTETETGKKIISAAGDAVDAGIDEAKKVGSAVADEAGKVADEAKQLGSAVADEAQKVETAVVEDAGKAVDAVSNAASAAEDALGNAASALGSLFSGD
jgi:hypothetical protein